MNPLYTIDLNSSIFDFSLSNDTSLLVVSTPGSSWELWKKHFQEESYALVEEFKEEPSSYTY